MTSVRESKSEQEQELRLAVLIDADNTPYNVIKQILDHLARFGRIVIKRAYGDWTTTKHQSWGNIFKEFAIRPIQQFQYTTGKNSSDSALIIDAMDILHQGRVDTFILVTSDSDFTGLASRIREEGLTVIGMGRQTIPSSFVKACDQFVLLENLTAGNIQSENMIIMSRGHESKATVDADTRGKGRDLLVRALQQTADENGFVKGAKLGVMLKRLDPSFSPASYGVRKLADFLELYRDLIVLQGKRVATDPTYKVMVSTKT